MCHFITAVLPASAPIDALDAIAREHGRAFTPLANASITEQLGAGIRYFATSSACDCGTPLGAALRTGRGRRAPDAETQRERMRKQGWSAAKIERAMAQRNDRLGEKQAAAQAQEQLAVDDWLGFLRAILASRATPTIGLLLHFYDGPLSARIDLEGREAVSRDALTAERLAQVREDVLYVFG